MVNTLCSSNFALRCMSMSRTTKWTSQPTFIELRGVASFNRQILLRAPSQHVGLEYSARSEWNTQHVRGGILCTLGVEYSARSGWNTQHVRGGILSTFWGEYSARSGGNTQHVLGEILSTFWVEYSLFFNPNTWCTRPSSRFCTTIIATFTASSDPQLHHSLACSPLLTDTTASPVPHC